MHDGDGIPCNILVQAVVKSTAEHGINLSARYYDLEVIRELCGCLVKIAPQEAYLYASHLNNTTFGVSFAHFTVQEYLDSTRISTISTTFSAACKENLWQNLTATVFREAYHVKMNEFWERDNPEEHACEVFFAMDNDFDTYSIVSAFLACLNWMAKLSRQDALCAFTYDFLDPSKHHLKSIGTILKFFDESTEYIEWSGFPLTAQMIWTVIWDNNVGDADARLLFNLLQITDDPSEQSLLVEYFMEGKDAGSLLQASLKFKSLVDFDDYNDYFSFDGQLIEILASLSAIEASTIRLLLEYDSLSYDPSALLFAYIGRHRHMTADSCEEHCLVEQFLERGADPDVLKYRITPLQVATICWDLGGFEALLRAAADPNHTGNCNGVVWEDNAFIGRFNYLHGANPLHICRHFKTILDDDHQRSIKGKHEKVEAKLLENGARDFQESHEV